MTVRSMLTIASAAIAADAYTTYAALTAPVKSFGEAGPGTAALISHHGLILGILTAALTRLAVFAFIGLLATAIRYRAPVIAIGYAGALATWFIAAQNVWTVTHP